ncbi:hypothetical protein VPH35_130061 [Triticum aestivum]
MASLPLDPWWRRPPSPGSTVAVASHPWIHAGGGLLRFRCGHSTVCYNPVQHRPPPLYLEVRLDSSQHVCCSPTPYLAVETCASTACAPSNKNSSMCRCKV